MKTGTTRDPREVIREEPMMHEAVLQALQGGPLTVPEIAEAIGKPSAEVVFWVMGMRRYRMIIELPEVDDDGYFKYRVGTSEVSG